MRSWLEWHGGTLRLTDVGRNVRDQVREVSAGLVDLEDGGGRVLG